ncbi:MAG TPA: beta-ketoacyl synthase N-terminal-like domain-containing protein [Vicinamibacterales bacterium]
MTESRDAGSSNAIAIVGMAGRFPQGRSVDEFWGNLLAGRECLTVLTDEDLEKEGIPPEIYRQPNYVKVAAPLEGADLWDATFFDVNPREAALTDPQQRLFLETAWEALEDAGYDAKQYAGAIGVFAGSAMNTYAYNFFSNRGWTSAADAFQAVIGNDKDYLSTRVSYKMDLRGPSVTVQTACSSSLVAVHLAAQALLGGECDMALAGGMSVRVPQRAGYFHQEGMVFSADGHCRTFDARAVGTLFGSGGAVVLLKRLADAVADGDTVRAIIRGSAINNDGSAKVGYTAPSVGGQSAVVAEALAIADVDPKTVSYIEAHGTGTLLGDPIEIEALTKAFRNGDGAGAKKSYCGIGSVKTNIGHLDAAAGIAGLVKTVLMLQHRQFVPSLHFTEPNPQIDFANSPFYVVDRSAPWSANGAPRRAGVSSFGIGGTNCHVVLEEAPAAEATPSPREAELIVLSAKTSEGLEHATDRLAAHLAAHPSASLADVAGTLSAGRRAFRHRRALVCRDVADARQALEQRDPRRLLSYSADRERPVAFMFPGGGAQHPRMAEGLYRTEPTFRAIVDRCAGLLQPTLGFDLRALMYPAAAQVDSAAATLKQIAPALPALFVTEYALARLWMAWGVRPDALIGHSVGEYAAACLAGVLTLEDALTVVAARGRLMATTRPGAMLTVARAEEDVLRYLDDRLALAVVNGPSWCVVSGPADAVDGLETVFARDGVEYRRVQINIASHSPVMDPILAEFTDVVRRCTLRPPSIPYLSNVTGTWITDADATDPAYYARHLRQTVRFGQGVVELFANRDRILLEVGPEQSLTTLARQHPGRAGQVVLPSLPHHDDAVGDAAFMTESLGRLWLTGSRVDWAGRHAHARPRRVPLPTYPFERKRHWIDFQGRAGHGVAVEAMESAPGADGQSAATPATRGSVARPALMNPYVAPSTEVERTVAAVWQRAFGIDQIGLHDNFFELGGTSLLATELTAQLNKALGTAMTVRAVLRAPTVDEIAQLVVQERDQRKEEIAAAILAQLSALSDEEAAARLSYAEMPALER